MSVQKIIYPLDLTGLANSNRISGELKTIGVSQYRAFALNYGPFFTESLIIVDRDKNLRLTRGVDYECIYSYTDLIKRSGGKEITGVIIITNKKVSTNLEITYNIVGGPYSANVYAIDKAIKDLDLDNRNSDWKYILNKPDTFQPAPHDHDFGDVYGMEYIVTLLNTISNSIVNGNSQVTDKLQDALNKAILEITTALNNHKKDYSNSHRVTAEQVNCYDKQAVDIFLTNIADRFDDLEPRLSEIIKNIAANLAKINALIESINNVSGRVSEVEKLQHNLNGFIAELNTRCDGIVNDISAINIEINALKEKDKILQSSIADCQNKIADNERDIETNKLSIIELHKKDGLLEQEINKLKERADNLHTSSGEHTQLINELNSSIVDLNNKHNTQQTQLDGIKNNVVNVSNNVVHLPNGLVIMTVKRSVGYGFHDIGFPVAVKEVLSIQCGVTGSGYWHIYESGCRVMSYNTTSCRIGYRYIGDDRGEVYGATMFVTIIGVK